MTVQYLDKLGAGSKGIFALKLVAIWKGSLYKLVWMDLIGYLILYYCINFVYRFALKPYQQRNFEEIVKFCDSMKNNIPISFLLGFFVSGVIARWFQMYLYIPYLNKMAFLIEGMVNGGEKDMCRKIRQTTMRYLNLSWILCMREVSDQIQIRFKQHDAVSIEEYGVRDTFVNFNRDRKIQATYRKIITDAEIRAFEAIAAKEYSKNKAKYLPEFWIPIQWASRLLQKAFVHGYISDSRTLNSLISDLDFLRGQMHLLQIFSGIMIPLVYTQVIIIAVYSYFLCQIFASQFVDTNMQIPGHEVDLYVPIFTVFQFLFFMGWLKVAMCVMNPFGDDDEDFQTSEILDYNLEISHRSVTADASMYPENLEPPGMYYNPQKNHEEDLLNVFMEDIDGDLEEIEPPNVEGDVTALEVKSSRCVKFMRTITCGLCKIFRSNISSPSPDKPKSSKFFEKKKHSVRNQESMEQEEKIEFQNDKLVQSV